MKFLGPMPRATSDAGPAPGAEGKVKTLQLPRPNSAFIPLFKKSGGLEQDETCSTATPGSTPGSFSMSSSTPGSIPRSCTFPASTPSQGQDHVKDSPQPTARGVFPPPPLQAPDLSGTEPDDFSDDRPLAQVPYKGTPMYQELFGDKSKGTPMYEELFGDQSKAAKRSGKQAKKRKGASGPVGAQGAKQSGPLPSPVRKKTKKEASGLLGVEGAKQGPLPSPVRKKTKKQGKNSAVVDSTNESGARLAQAPAAHDDGMEGAAVLDAKVRDNSGDETPETDVMAPFRKEMFAEMDEQISKLEKKKLRNIPKFKPIPDGMKIGAEITNEQIAFLTARDKRRRNNDQRTVGRKRIKKLTLAVGIERMTGEFVETFNQKVESFVKWNMKAMKVRYPDKKVFSFPMLAETMINCPYGRPQRKKIAVSSVNPREYLRNMREERMSKQAKRNVATPKAVVGGAQGSKKGKKQPKKQPKELKKPSAGH